MSTQKKQAAAAPAVTDSRVQLQLQLTREIAQNEGPLTPRAKKFVDQLMPVLEPFNFTKSDIHNLVKRCDYDSVKVDQAVAEIYADSEGRATSSWTEVRKPKKTDAGVGAGKPGKGRDTEGRGRRSDARGARTARAPAPAKATPIPNQMPGAISLPGSGAPAAPSRPAPRQPAPASAGRPAQPQAAAPAPFVPSPQSGSIWKVKEPQEERKEAARFEAAPADKAADKLDDPVIMPSALHGAPLHVQFGSLSFGAAPIDDYEHEPAEATGVAQLNQSAAPAPPAAQGAHEPAAPAQPEQPAHAQAQAQPFPSQAGSPFAAPGAFGSAPSFSAAADSAAPGDVSQMHSFAAYMQHTAQYGLMGPQPPFPQYGVYDMPEDMSKAARGGYREPKMAQGERGADAKAAGGAPPQQMPMAAYSQAPPGMAGLPQSSQYGALNPYVYPYMGQYQYGSQYPPYMNYGMPYKAAPPGMGAPYAGYAGKASYPAHSHGHAGAPASQLPATSLGYDDAMYSAQPASQLPQASPASQAHQQGPQYSSLFGQQMAEPAISQKPGAAAAGKGPAPASAAAPQPGAYMPGRDFAGSPQVAMGAFYSPSYGGQQGGQGIPAAGFQSFIPQPHVGQQYMTQQPQSYQQRNYWSSS